MGVAAGGGARLRASSAKKQRQRTLNNIKITLRDGNGYKSAGFCRPKPVPVKNIYAH
jgi:hypothetical protein